jgi:hypothetical protein
VKVSLLNGGISTYITPPAYLSNRSKAALLNIRNNDNYCFVWSILASLFPVDTNSDPMNTNSYPQNMHDILNLKDITFPLSLCNVHKFEANNLNLNINIYSSSNDKKKYDIFPVYASKNSFVDNNKIINLFYIPSYHHQRGHYCLITDLASFCFKQISCKSHKKKFICTRCLNYFSLQSTLDAHLINCQNSSTAICRVNLPSNERAVLKFSKFSSTLMSPYVIYADFEALNIPISTASNSPNLPYVLDTHKQEPFSVAYMRVCHYDESLNKFEMYRGTNPVNWFLTQIKEEAVILSERFRQDFTKLDMHPLTIEQQTNHAAMQNCELCNYRFDEYNAKVVHHCHFTGKFINTLCNNCNLQCRYNPQLKVPIFFHNLSRYDAHFLIQDLANLTDNFGINHPLKVVPSTTETYIAFSKKINWVNFQFLDSFRFMPSSLQNLVDNLTDEQMIHTKSIYLNQKDFQLMRRKGVFPYQYIDTFNRLLETKLPPLEAFYSNLTESNISDEDYAHANRVWKEFGCKTLGEYADLYLKTDVYLLADVFENYRKLTMRTYGLDAADFITAPGLAFAAALKISKIEIQLLQDIDMVLFFEKGLRGGICQVSCKHAVSNSPYSENFDPNRDTKEILNVDANGLYASAMTSPLPYGDFKWIEDLNDLFERINNGTIDSLYSSKLTKSCIIECDIYYPQALHDEHVYFPFCPEHQITSMKERKLMLTLHNKTKYIIHLENLLQCLKHGLKLVKIHRAIEFSQSDWLKKFIDLNADLRAKATNSFDKGLYKDLSNMTYGKLMENVRKYREIYIINSWDKAKKYFNKPNYKACTIFNESLVAIEMNKTSVVYNKPLYIGTCILDLSKTIIYSFIYDYLKVKVEPDFQVTILYSDTDSVIAAFTKKKNSQYNSIYEIVKRDANEIFDTSNFKQDNKYDIPLVNCRINGKMKDECQGRIIAEFIGIRAKVYTIKIEDSETIKKHKGIGRTAVRRLEFEDYKNALLLNQSLMSKFSSIQSKGHNIYAVEINKTTLTNFDDKRKMLENDKINSVPWGHYSIMDWRT